MTPKLLPKDAKEAQRVIEMRRRVAHRNAIMKKRDLAERRKYKAFLEQAFHYTPEDDN